LKSCFTVVVSDLLDPQDAIRIQMAINDKLTFM
jgi:hypothetical protein